MLTIIYISLLIVAIVIALIGWQYALLAHKSKRENEYKNLYMREHLNPFWVSDCSGSMHKQKIFVISPSDLGL